MLLIWVFRQASADMKKERLCLVGGALSENAVAIFKKMVHTICGEDVMNKIPAFKTLPLSNWFMFGEVMRHESVCRLFLKELLHCEIARIEFISKKMDLSDTVGMHGIRLDVYLSDANNTHYDIEMQNTADAIELRSRYYQSGIDRKVLEAGKTYKELPRSFIIFICNFDYIGDGKAYHERVSHYSDSEKEYNDGTRVILLNAKYGEKNNISPAIAEFLDYIRDANDNAKFLTPLAQEAQQLTQKVRNDKEKEVAYMTFAAKLQETYDSGYESGVTAKLYDIVRRMLSRGKSPDSIANEIGEDISVIQSIADSADKPSN